MHGSLGALIDPFAPRLRVYLGRAVLLLLAKSGPLELDHVPYRGSGPLMNGAMPAMCRWP